MRCRRSWSWAPACGPFVLNQGLGPDLVPPLRQPPAQLVGPAHGAVAADVGALPLDHARRTAARCGVEDRMDLRLGPASSSFSTSTPWTAQASATVSPRLLGQPRQCMPMDRKMGAVWGAIAIAGLVPEGCGCLADIGTDHGYVPVSLLLEGRIRRAVAADIGAPPLEHARRTSGRNARKTSALLMGWRSSRGPALLQGAAERMSTTGGGVGQRRAAGGGRGPGGPAGAGGVGRHRGRGSPSSAAPPQARASDRAGISPPRTVRMG